MSTLKLMHVPNLAPGCYIIARQRSDGSFDPTIEADTLLVQSDWDWPGIARDFGWDMSSFGDGHRCDHSGSDGTIDCPECGTTASDFIVAAGKWLDRHIGATVDDPGYFNA